MRELFLDRFRDIEQHRWFHVVDHDNVSATGTRFKSLFKVANLIQSHKREEKGKRKGKKNDEKNDENDENLSVDREHNLIKIKKNK